MGASTLLKGEQLRNSACSVDGRVFVDAKNKSTRTVESIVQRVFLATEAESNVGVVSGA